MKVLLVVVAAVLAAGLAEAKKPEKHRAGAVSVVWGRGDIDLITGYYGGTSNLPPGLAKRQGNLPPGLAKRGGNLPPGLAKRLSRFPPDLERRLGPLPRDCGCRRGILDGQAVILRGEVILDVFALRVTVR